MANKVVTRRELLDRWRSIEEVDDGDDDASSDTAKRNRLRQLKEKWFSDAFNFLINLPNEDHIWCSSWDLMGPLLETFYNYFKDERNDSPLKLLLKRIADEMRHCTQCICQHHQAQDMYNAEYESSSIDPLLNVLQSLDEERITEHLKEMNARIARGEYDPVHDNSEVVTIMFEVLMFPVLLDDRLLASEFQIFIEAIDESHELTLAGHQQYPGVYALLFMKSRRTRSIGLRLAGYAGKLRRPSDLEPLQPLLKKFIGFLETEAVASATKTSRPRVQLERITVWLGIKALLGFLEPLAFEEGILERYPVFLSIVLNHISDDSIEFSYAVNCLRLLFEMLGCKLWLRATLSPSVMRNTLVGQCFHTRTEKSHKEIFDLFQPFLQSLEALQDGEHEKQRRHFLYFLLHQVTVSSNFSILMRKKACQIALKIIDRGYKMNPPCPPFECAHMWGPSLVSSLKDSSLHNSLRQPAFDLIQTIIVSDAAALVTSILNFRAPSSTDRIVCAELIDEDDPEVLPLDHNIEEKEISCWKEFSTQSYITSQEYKYWMCIPMLWFDVLVEIGPSILPVSFSKAVFWALSRFSMVETDNGTEMALPVGQWLATSAPEVSHLFGWKAPSGSDDGGDGKEFRNSIKLSTMCMPLIRTFKRLTTQFVVRMEQCELWKQWTWEPRMGETLILLLVDPNDNGRQVARRILEQVSSTRGLASGLQFLCSCPSSLTAIFLGLRHALKLVQLDSVLLKFQTLHHFFFVLCKLLKEGFMSTVSGKLSDDFSSQGGFLRQPIFESSSVVGNLSIVDPTCWDKFSCFLSEIAWPTIKRCLSEGKAFVDYKVSQMTCIRLLETLPVIFKRIFPSFHDISENSDIMGENGSNFGWLHDLMDWGKSSLSIVVRYWKQTVVSLIGLLKGVCRGNSFSTLRAIENLISCENVAMDLIEEKVSHLCISLRNKGGYADGKTKMKPTSLIYEGISRGRMSPGHDAEPFSSENANVQIMNSSSLLDMGRGDVIVISDNEVELEDSFEDVNHSFAGSSCVLHGKALTAGAAVQVQQDDDARKNISSIVTICDSENDVIDSCAGSSQQMLHGETLAVGDAVQVQKDDKAREYVSGIVTLKDLSESSLDTNSPNHAGSVPHNLKFGMLVGREASTSLAKSTAIDSVRKDFCSDGLNSSFLPHHKSDLKSSSDKKTSSETRNHQGINKVSVSSDAVIKKFIHDAEDNSWDFTLKSFTHQQSRVMKPIAPVPKRQVIQLNLPGENRYGNLYRLGGAVQRFKPPRLDNWYKPILELDYFATVGLAPGNEQETRTVTKLKEVPLCFSSADEYVDIFRPLVLEEFKAQLHSSFRDIGSMQEMCCGCLSVLSVERIDDFHIVRCIHDDVDSAGSRSCLENDLILVTRQPMKSSPGDVHMVGKVERRERDNKKRSSVLVIRFYLLNGSSRLNRARKLLAERSKWYIVNLMSITPQLREFQALSSIKDIPVLSIILNPISHPPCSYESTKDLGKISQPLQQILVSSYNGSQLNAISAAIGPVDPKKLFNFCLVQGPPGTGKTRTIMVIVSCLLMFSQQTNDRKRSQNCALRAGNTSCNNSKLRISQSAAIARAWQDAAFARQMNEEDNNYKLVSNCRRGRVLICAQSNAAVDELVSRISSEGLHDSDGVMYKPYLVRVGNAKTVHPNSLPFFIDTLVDHRLAEEMTNLSNGNNEMNGDSSSILRSNLEKLVDRIRFFEAKRANTRDGNSESKHSLEGEAPKGDDAKEMSDIEIEAKLRKLYDEKKSVYRDLTAAQMREKKANEESRALKYKLRKSILKEAQIVVTTLSGCGGDLYGVCSESILSHKFGNSPEDTLFDAVVIDEAAQALEPATLIPLQLLKSKGTKCIMVGDPKQLPATVLSNVASKYMYQCSMFERLQRAGHPVIMLTDQYRMHPEICRFPSLHFYDGKLLNGDKMCSKDAPFHEIECLGPYVFFDIIDGLELHGKNSGAMSLYNDCEADAAVELLKYFKGRYPAEFVGGRIGIITPYKCQLSLLRSRFSSAFGSSVTADMEFNTVDGFQGREVDILILSTVRAAEPGSTAMRINSCNIGFVADVRRMNVALTRAKLSLWILGNGRTLKTNQNWAALLKDAEERNLILSARRPYGAIFKSAMKISHTSDNSDSHLQQLRRSDKIKEVGKNAKVEEKTNSSFGRKRKYKSCGGQDDNNGAGDECVVLARKKTATYYKRRAKNERPFSSKKDLTSAALESSVGTTVDMNCGTAGDQVTNEESGGKKMGEKKHHVGIRDVVRGSGSEKLKRRKNEESRGEKMDEKKHHVGIRDVDRGSGSEKLKSNSNLKHSKRQMGGSSSSLKLDALEELPKSVGRAERKETKNIEISSSEGSFKVREGNDGSGPSTKDAIMKRKQQREAVDALLSSALISSKKSGTSRKPLPNKRHPSPIERTGHGSKPPKPKKVPPPSSSSSAHDQIHQRREGEKILKDFNEA